MRVAILETNGYLDKQIVRLLAQHGIKGDIEPTINRQVIHNYDFVIVTYQNDIPNCPVLLERTVLEQKIHVIYIANTVSIGQFHSVYHDKYFNLVQELTIETELPLMIRLVQKYMSEIDHLQTKASSLSEELFILKQTNKAKRILMDKGFTEPQAHQYIQQKAMDLRISKKRLVNLIIENKIDF